MYLLTLAGIWFFGVITGYAFCAFLTTSAAADERQERLIRRMGEMGNAKENKK